MNSKHNMGNENMDQSWIGWVTLSTIIFAILIAGGLCALASCSPKIIEKIETRIEYRDRVVHDTTTFEIEKEVEKIVTMDTISHLENKYAKSDAVVSQGFLSHSLESKPQVIKIPVEVHVTDTIWKESQVIEKEVKVEKELSWWQKTRINAFWYLLVGLILSLVWIFRKQLLAILKLL